MNKNMKNLHFLYILFFIFSSSAFCSEISNNKNLNFDFSIGPGVTGGLTREYVFYSDGDLMSRLDWQEYCTPSINLKAEADIYHAVITGEYYTVIPVRVGMMEDWDYLKEDKTTPTNYSKSELNNNKNYKMKILAGYEFCIDKFKILPQIGFCYQNKKFESYNGYFQYGSYDNSNGGYWSSDLQKYRLYGTCITYEQQYFIPSINLQTSYSLNDDWSFLLYGYYSPYIKADASDFHCASKEKMVEYNDYMKNGNGFSIGIGTKYKNFGFYLEYEYAQVKEGHSAQRDISTTSSFLDTTDTKPGTDYSLLTFKILYTF